LFNLAYIGSSPISEFHIPVLRKAGFNISSISSRKDSKNIKKFAQKFNIKNIIPDWKKLHDIVDNFDAIMIAVDIDVTCEILNNLMEINKPILVEKPVSIKSKEIEKIIEKNNDKIFVAYNRRYYNSVEWVKKFIESKSNVSATFFIPERNQLNFYHNSSHIIDLMNYFFKDLKLENTTHFTIDKKLSGLTAIFKTKRGDIINLISNWNAPSNFKIEVIHKDEKMELNPIEKAHFYKGMEIIEPTIEDPIRKYMPKLIKESENGDEFKPGFYKQAKVFYNFVKCNQLDERMCTLKQAKENIKTIEKLFTTQPYS